MKKGDVVFRLLENIILVGRITRVYKKTLGIDLWECRNYVKWYSPGWPKSECTTNWNVAEKHVLKLAKRWKGLLMKEMNLI